ncbi:MAG TPA: alcohol dehydrogenase catalytic domain-containing protein [Thermodesulfovibrionales bacterium]|nr:alcohol dehydrogenase catalytic domain-containing protein [Thermodesulfovibrionales bacterium]
MIANVLIKPGLIELRELETPSPSRGEILVRVMAALTCGTDLKAFKRGHPVIPMPGVFGHEFSGVVAKVGSGVRNFRVNDEIMAVHSAPCLECRYCRKRLYNLCENIMLTKVLGAFSEYVLLPSHIVRQNVFLKPHNISFEEAAFLEPLSCVVHGMNSLGVKKGDRALVIGAGPIGLLHLLLLKLRGAQVTVADKHTSKLRVARELGSDYIHRVAGNKMPGHQQRIKSRLSDPKGDSGFIGFDYVFECTGIPEVWEESAGYVRRGGTVVLFGGCRSGASVTYDASRLHYDEITLKGVFHFSPEDVRKAYELLCGRNLNVSRLITGSYTMNHVSKAFVRLAKGRGIKFSFKPSGKS